MFNPLLASCLVPAVYFGLLYFGVLTHGRMRRWRWWSWIAILLLAAVITPTGDIFTMLLLAAPMVVCHEVIVWSAAMRERRMRAIPHPSTQTITLKRKIEPQISADIRG